MKVFLEAYQLDSCGQEGKVGCVFFQTNILKSYEIPAAVILADVKDEKNKSNEKTDLILGQVCQHRVSSFFKMVNHSTVPQSVKHCRTVI